MSITSASTAREAIGLLTCRFLAARCFQLRGTDQQSRVRAPPPRIGPEDQPPRQLLRREPHRRGSGGASAAVRLVDEAGPGGTGPRPDAAHARLHLLSTRPPDEEAAGPACGSAAAALRRGRLFVLDLIGGACVGLAGHRSPG